MAGGRRQEAADGSAGWASPVLQGSMAWGMSTHLGRDAANGDQDDQHGAIGGGVANVDVCHGEVHDVCRKLIDHTTNAQLRVQIQ
jgi:hypothetical protein